MSEMLLEPPSPRPKSRPLENPVEPGRLWIRYLLRPRPASRLWPGPSCPWLDFSTLAPVGLERLLEEPVETAEPPPFPHVEESFDDVVYLPPVIRPRMRGWADVATRLPRRHTPLVIHGFPPGTAVNAAEPPPDLFDAFMFYDLLPGLLRLERQGFLASLGRLDRGSTAVWPLIPGVTDDPALWEEACRLLAATHVAALVVVVPQLSPADRRVLVERFGDHLLEPLFHGAPPSTAPLARVARRHGLQPFPPRGGRTTDPFHSWDRPRGNRSLATELALAAELSDRLGRPERQVQELWRAFREVDRSLFDLEAMARDGNLDLLDWLHGDALEIVEQSLTQPPPPLVEALLEEYAGPGEPLRRL